MPDACGVDGGYTSLPGLAGEFGNVALAGVEGSGSYGAFAGRYRSRTSS